MVKNIVSELSNNLHPRCSLENSNTVFIRISAQPRISAHLE